MNVEKAIEKRKSIRKFKDKKLEDEKIDKLIEAAILAPSGNNAQPWRFYIVRTKEDKKKLKENNIIKQDFLYQAPIIIVCCGDPTVYPKSLDMDDSNELRAVRDLSLACENLVLRATELGLGTCFVGWIKKEKIKEVLGIPKKLIVPYVIPVGYPAKEPKRRKRKSKEEILL